MSPTPFDQWTLKTIRYDASIMNWLEERRYEWIALASDALQRIVSGQSVLVLTDNERDWFARYIVQSVNRSASTRPFVPIYDLKELFPNIQNFTTNEEIELLYDMFSISFANGFFVWYIGRPTSKYVKIAKGREDNFLWIMDEDMQNNFTLKSYDELLDLKLVQLFRLFDKSLDAAMFGEVSFS